VVVLVQHPWDRLAESSRGVKESGGSRKLKRSLTDGGSMSPVRWYLDRKRLQEEEEGEEEEEEKRLPRWNATAAALHTAVAPCYDGWLCSRVLLFRIGRFVETSALGESESGPMGRWWRWIGPCCVRVSFARVGRVLPDQTSRLVSLSLSVRRIDIYSKLK
jgi:hypothetical protein